MPRSIFSLGAAILGATIGLLASCGGDSQGSGGGDACPEGVVCGPGTGTGTATGTGTGTATGTGTGTGTQTGNEAWLCSPWERAEGASSDDATRTCIDLNASGSEDYKPVEAVTLPALDENYYRCNVEPILDRTCAQMGCHGVEPDLPNQIARSLRLYHRGRLRRAGYTIQGDPGCLNEPDYQSEDCIGSAECACASRPHLPMEWQCNFDAARGFALDAQGNPLGDMAQAELLTQPLKGGGLAHAGIKTWTETDTEYATIKAWLEGATLGSCNSAN
ncbi:MAG: hypothetical protein R3B72_41290 [Polyangiaceae bacterium]